MNLDNDEYICAVCFTDNLLITFDFDRMPALNFKNFKIFSKMLLPASLDFLNEQKTQTLRICGSF